MRRKVSRTYGQDEPRETPRAAQGGGLRRPHPDRREGDAEGEARRRLPALPKSLGACNPKLAHQALTSEVGLGVMLPCNVAVWEDDAGKVTSRRSIRCRRDHLPGPEAQAHRHPGPRAALARPRAARLTDGRVGLPDVPGVRGRMDLPAAGRPAPRRRAHLMGPATPPGRGGRGRGPRAGRRLLKQAPSCPHALATRANGRCRIRYAIPDVCNSSLRARWATRADANVRLVSSRWFILAGVPPEAFRRAPGGRRRVCLLRSPRTRSEAYLAASVAAQSRAASRTLAFTAGSRSVAFR